MTWAGMQYECNLGRAGVSKPSHRVMRRCGFGPQGLRYTARQRLEELIKSAGPSEVSWST